MLRFGTSTSERRSLAPSRERRRLWMLLGAACLVVWSIQFLQRPETAERLDSLFLVTEQDPDAASGANKEFEPAEEVLVEPPVAVKIPEAEPQARAVTQIETDIDLSVIKDNTYFRSEENPAWFAILDHVRQEAAEKISSDSIGQVGYAQLLEQPDVYRGQVVTVRGTVMREETLAAPENDIGLTRYHRLVIRPKGGGVWPIVVYCLDLPAKFPRGENSQAEITAHGVFFKNWSYSWRDGLGLAPVILAKAVDWQPLVAVKPTRSKITPGGVIGVISGGALLAAVVGWLAWKQSRRPTARDIVISPPATEGEQ